MPNSPNSSHTKQYRVDQGRSWCRIAEVAVVMVSVEVTEALPGVTEAGESEQDGAGEGPATEHES